MLFADDSDLFYKLSVLLFSLFKQKGPLIGLWFNVKPFFLNELELLCQTSHLLLKWHKLFFNSQEMLLFCLKSGNLLVFKFQEFVAFRNLAFAFKFHRVQLYGFNFERPFNWGYFGDLCCQFSDLSLELFYCIVLFLHLLFMFQDIKSFRIVGKGVVGTLQISIPTVLLKQ